MTGDHLATAFAAAIVLALFATPLVRRLAWAHGFLDRPRPGRSHHRSTPYLGGLAIIAAANVGALLGGGLNATTGRILTVATVLGAVGLVDDRGPIGPAPRLACELLAGALLWQAGVRFELTGSPIADGLFSLVWLVGITNAFNLLDNMDGLSAGAAGLAALGAGGVALAAGEVQVAVVAVAVSGACLGFLAFNARPATIFMGDAGSLFVGAAVAVLALAAHPPGPASVRAVVPLLIVGLPLLDTATVALGRARRDISILQGGRDHLSHRLVGLGLRRRTSVRTLLMAEAVSAGSAVAVARGWLDPWLAVGVAGMVFAGLWLWASRARVYDDPVVGLPRVARWTVLGGVAAAIGLSVPASLAMARSRAPLQIGASAAQAGLQHEESGATATARQDFALAAASFATARQRLAGASVSAAAVIPVVAANLRAARVLARTGLRLSRAGQELAAGTDARSLSLQHGTVPLDTLARLAPRLQTLSVQLTSASAQVHRLPRTLLLPEIRRAVAQLDGKLARTALQIRRSADAAAMVPDLLGAHGPRRYLLVIQNNAEARATGGFIGNFGELLVRSGHFTRGRFDRIALLNAPEGTDRAVPAPADYLARYARFSPFDLWQNVNLSPDFPTVGSIAAALYARADGAAVDGVIGVDPVALSDVLRLTGPIQVAPWPVPITADNVVQITLQGAYDALANDQRVAFLGDVARAAFDAVTSRDLGNPVHLAHVLGPAVSAHHLQLYLVRPFEEAFASRLSASGSFVPASGDQLLVTTQNASANKVDYYLRRRVNYQVSIDPASVDLQGATSARLSGELAVELTNGAPDRGHSADALGPYDGRFRAGENRTFLSIYTPLAVSTGALDGASLALESGIEFGQHVYSTFVAIPAGSTRTVSLKMAGSIQVDAGGWYTLDLPRQPALGTDRLTVTVTVPVGWQIQPDPAGAGWSRRAVVAIDLNGPQRLRLRLRQTGALTVLDPVVSPGTSAQG